ncbi:MAG: RidA family protein [Chitinophagales bacterium]|nr:RidA family protein [Chitinophagales bacterium]MCO5270777.1 RidA family protein [Cyclobacteriaceae bacterium]OJV27056.1 MAG: 2-aminomuconate deaminase [Bacteroidetes bacterium 37-13]MCO5281772.1 RidA family protein [Chitinophagales bacterium]HRN95010.1 RidA family protein [Chitinophagales bacterium]
MEKQNLPKPMGLYPMTRKVGNLIFVSGMGPREAGTDNIPGLQLDKHGNYISFDFEAQVHSVFKNVKTALEEAGSNWNKIVDVTIFLVNMKRDFHTFNKIYAQYFSEAQPCRTTVEVQSLPSAIAIEIKVIAEV